MLFFRRTLRTQSFQYIIDTVKRKSFRKFYYWCRYVFEAKGTVTSFAMEVGVQVFYTTRTAGAAYGVLERPCTIIDAVYQVMRQKQGECTEDA